MPIGQQELCFVLMPFENSRRDHETTSVNFDDLYDKLIDPAVREVGLEPIRADQELQGGIFHKTMFERLATCTFAIADLSLPNPNVFYELGIRHALRPWSTVLMFQEGLQLPLDVALDAAMTYPEGVLGNENLMRIAKEQLCARLQAAEVHHTDSPVLQLVSGLQTHEVDHRRVDALVESATRDSQLAQRVVEAQRQGAKALSELRAELGDLRRTSPEVVSAMVMSFRAQERWREMVDAIESADSDFANVWVIQEQLALALGRLGEFDRSVALLKELIARRPNSESYGLLGGVYRRQWKQALTQGRPNRLAQGAREKALEAYRSGFECDWRDPYPGVNAVVLSALANVEATLRDPLFGAVKYAVSRRLSLAEVEYWDYACALQLAIVEGQTTDADRVVPAWLLLMDQPFKKTSTLDSLRDLEPVSVTHGNQDWHAELVAEVESR